MDERRTVDTSNPAYKHGHASRGGFSPEYHSWAAMHSRCKNTSHAMWPYYGGRGVRVCAEWSSFEQFLADMGPRPFGKTLDRWPNPAGNYEPSNCRWATRREQSANRTGLGAVSAARREKILKILRGRPATIPELQKKLRVHVECVKQDIRRLRSEGQIVTHPKATAHPRGRTLLCTLVTEPRKEA